MAIIQPYDQKRKNTSIGRKIDKLARDHEMVSLLGDKSKRADVTGARLYAQYTDFHANEEPYSGPRSKVARNLVLAGALVMAASSAGCFYKVGPGEAAVEWGAMSGTDDADLGDGRHFAMPFFEDYYIVDMKVKKFERTYAVGLDSENGTIEVPVTVAMQYQVKPGQAHKVVTGISGTVEDTIFDPNIAQMLKVITPRYGLDKIVPEREEIARQLQENITPVADKYWHDIDKLQIVNVGLPDAIKNRNEALLVAQTNVEIAKLGADARREEAKGIADYDREVANGTKDAMETISEFMDPEAWFVIKQWKGDTPLAIGPDGQIIIPTGRGTSQQVLP